MLREAKPHCSTLHTRLSRAAHVDVNTVEPTLSDTDVRDLSRIRTEKQDIGKAQRPTGLQDEDKSRPRDVAVRFTLESIGSLGVQDKTVRHASTHTKDMSLPVTSWEMLCLQSPRPRATGPRERGGGATPVP